MADDSGVRQTITGALLAGGVAVVVLSAMASLNLGDGIVQVVVAIALGVAVAQFYEYRWA